MKNINIKIRSYYCCIIQLQLQARPISLTPQPVKYLLNNINSDNTQSTYNYLENNLVSKVFWKLNIRGLDTCS